MNKKTSAWAAIGLFSVIGAGGILYNSKDIYGHIQNSFLGKIVDSYEAKTTSDKKQEPQNRNLEFKLAEFLRNRDKLPISLRVPDFTGNYFSIVSKGRNQINDVVVKPKNFNINRLVDAVDSFFNDDISGVESLISDLPYAINGMTSVQRSDNVYNGNFTIPNNPNNEIEIEFLLGNYEEKMRNSEPFKMEINNLIIKKENDFIISVVYYPNEIGLSVYKNKVGISAISISEYSLGAGGIYSKSDINNYIPAYLLLKHLGGSLPKMDIPVNNNLQMDVMNIDFSKFKLAFITVSKSGKLMSIINPGSDFYKK